MSEPKEYWPSEDPSHFRDEGRRGRRSLDPYAPHLSVLGRGFIGIVPWVICAHGDNLRIAIGRRGEGGHVEFDVGTRGEFDQLLALAGALFGAHKEIPL